MVVTGKVFDADRATTLGLLGDHDSLAYRVAEIERHLHTREKWFGAAAVPNGEIHVADRMNQAAPFTLTTGNSDFGSWTQVLGSSDSEISINGFTTYYFDLHSIMIVAASNSAVYTMQMIYGESAELAGKVAQEQMTEILFKRDTAAIQSSVEEIRSFRFPVNSKVWMRIAAVGVNAQTLGIYFGLHCYEG